MQTGMSDNLQDLNDIPKTNIIDRELKRLNIDIAALQETRLADFGSVTKRNYTFFWQGLKGDQRRLHGVGFAVKNNLIPMIETPKEGTERILSLRIKTSAGYATFISCYAPTLVADTEIKDQFYHQLDDKVNEIPSSDTLFLLGDFNARVGAEVTLWPLVLGKHGIGNTNDNGQRLLQFCSYHHLCITNTLFKNKDMHKASWRHPRSKTWHQLDLVISKQKDSKNVHNTRAYHSADCNTDHSIIKSKIKIVPKRIFSTKKKCTKKIDTTRISNPDKVTKFEQLFLSASPEPDSDEGSSQSWNRMREDIHNSALEAFGEKRKANKDWFGANSETIIPTLEAKRTAMLAHKSDPSEVNKINYKRCRSQAQKIARQCANSYYCTLSEKIQKASDTGNIRRMYEGIKQVIGKEVKKPAPLKSKTGELLDGKAEKLDRLVEHYTDLYATETNVSDSALEALPQLPTMTELDTKPSMADLNKAIDALS